MRSGLDTLLRTRSLSRFVPRQAIQPPSLSGPAFARIRNPCRHLFEKPAGVSERSRQPQRTLTPGRSEEPGFLLLLAQPPGLDHLAGARLLSAPTTPVLIGQ